MAPLGKIEKCALRILVLLDSVETGYLPRHLIREVPGEGKGSVVRALNLLERQGHTRNENGYVAILRSGELLLRRTRDPASYLQPRPSKGSSMDEKDPPDYVPPVLLKATDLDDSRGPILDWKEIASKVLLYGGLALGGAWKCGDLLVETHEYMGFDAEPFTYTMQVTVSKAGRAPTIAELIDALCLFYPAGSRAWFTHFLTERRSVSGPFTIVEMGSCIGLLAIRMYRVQLTNVTHQALLRGEVPPWDREFPPSPWEHEGTRVWTLAEAIKKRVDDLAKMEDRRVKRSLTAPKSPEGPDEEGPLPG